MKNCLMSFEQSKCCFQPIFSLTLTNFEIHFIYLYMLKNVNAIPTVTSWKYFAILWVFSSYLICCWLSDFGFLCSWHIFTFDFVRGLVLTNDFDTYKRIFFGNILVEKYLHKGIFPLMPGIFFSISTFIFFEFVQNTSVFLILSLRS